MKKRIVLIVLVGIFLLMLPIIAGADIVNGVCGENVSWTLDTQSGVLTINGSGDMYDYSGLSSNLSPFNQDPTYYSNYIKTINIEDGITSIGDYLFFNCGRLENISISNSVIRIGDSAFAVCSKIEVMDLSSNTNLHTIGYGAFSYCDELRRVVLPDNLKSLGASAFDSCPNITNLNVPSSLEYAGGGSIPYDFIPFDQNGLWIVGDALVRCSKKDRHSAVTIPNTVSTIREGAFEQCDIPQVTIPTSVKEIGVYAFAQCSYLSSVNLPDSILSIGRGAFSNCPSLYAIKLPSGITTIEYATFRLCRNLRTITIPATVSHIKREAFEGCTNLQVINYEGSETLWNEILIESGAANFSNSTIIYNHCLHTLTAHPAIAASCTNEGNIEYWYCSKCGKYFSDAAAEHEIALADTVIAALGHDLVHYEAKAVTCTEIGWNAYDTCSRCDYTTYVEKAALGHDLIHHEAQAATCTAIGWDEYDTCSRCDHTTYVEIPALDHDLVHHEAHAATCMEVGWEAYDTCSRCDHTTYVEIPAQGHDLIHHEDKAATCTEIGWDAYDTCSRCDYTTYVEIPALGHNLIHHEAQAPTCTAIGWDEYDTCSRCDYTTYVETPALGHDLEHHEAQVPTDTDVGWTGHDTCKRDGCTYNTRHILTTDMFFRYSPAPSCSSGGVAKYICDQGDNGLHFHEIEVPALGHDLVRHEAQAPTCTAIGWDAYETCSRCDYMTYVEIPALGHNLIHHEAQAPTCTAIGWNAYETCTRCDHTTYVEIPAMGHDLVQHEAKAATCEEIGWNAYETCTRCDHTTYVEIPALGHDLVHHEAKAPTCTEIGWDAYDTCSRCDYSTYVEKAALGHTLKAHTKVDATCTEAGTEAYWDCDACNKLFSDATAEHEIEAPIAIAAGHDWEEPIYTLNDNQTVTAKHICKRNPNHIETETVDVVYVGNNEPNMICGYTYDRYYFDGFLNPAFTDTSLDVTVYMPHGWNTYYVWHIRNGNCEAHGECRRCLDSLTNTVNISSQKTKDATCEDPEEITYYADFEDIDNSFPEGDYPFSHQEKTIKNGTALGHDDPMEHTAAVAATCTAVGNTEYWHCTKCDKYFSDAAAEHEIALTDTVIPAAGHDDPMEHTDAVEETCTTEGNIEYWHCTKCDKYFSDVAAEHEIALADTVIPAAGHDDPMEHTDAVEETCTTAGNTEYWHCTKCGKYFSDAAAEHEIALADTVIAATGHDWNTAEYKWSNDKTSVTATHTCKHEATHAETETVDVTAIIISPNDETEGSATYISSEFTKEGFNIQTKNITIPVLKDMSVIRLPNMLNAIEDEAFSNLACQAIIIPEGCTTIGESAFAGCTNLLYIKIPASVKSYPASAFEGCNENLVIDWAKE